jgi:hypothetical protein
MVKTARALRAEGLSLGDVARELAKLGYNAKTGARFTRTTIARMTAG